MSIGYVLAGIAVMAVTTYLIRVLPMVIFRKKITSAWIKSFLYYVPYVVLAAMTFPAVFTSTGSVLGATAGTLVAIALAYFDRGLLTVAVGAAAVVFVVQSIGF